MSFDLYNQADGYLKLASWQFTEIKDLAKRYGWEPMGTLMDEDHIPDWDGNYSTNDGQIICEEDLQALIKALDAAMSAGLLMSREDEVNVLDFLGFCRESEYLVIY